MVEVHPKQTVHGHQPCHQRIDIKGIYPVKVTRFLDALFLFTHPFFIDRHRTHIRHSRICPEHPKDPPLLLLRILLLLPLPLPLPLPLVLHLFRRRLSPLLVPVFLHRRAKNVASAAPCAWQEAQVGILQSVTDQ